MAEILQQQKNDDLKNLSLFLDKDKKFTIVHLANYFNTTPFLIKKEIKKQHCIDKVIDFYDLSYKETKIKNLLDKLGFQVNKDYLIHYRKTISPFELDFYFPKYRLAIEVSPNYTHNDKNSLYHYNKFKMCENKEIELITIFDWYSIENLEDYLRSKLMKNIKIYARNCNIIYDNSKKQDKVFLKENYTMKNIKIIKCKKVIRLFYENELVGIGLFNDKEIIDIIFKKNITVIGGMSKIIKNYQNISQTNELYTFTSNNLTTGSTLRKLKFTLQEEVKTQLIHNIQDCGYRKWYLKGGFNVNL